MSISGQSLESSLSADFVGSIVGHDDPTTVIANTRKGEASDGSISANSVSTANESLLQLDASESRSIADSSLQSGNTSLPKRSTDLGRTLNELDRKEMEWQAVHQVSAIPEDSMAEYYVEEVGKFEHILSQQEQRNDNVKGKPEDDDSSADQPFSVLPAGSEDNAEPAKRENSTLDGEKQNSNAQETDEIVRKVRERLSGDEIVRKVQERLSAKKQEGQGNGRLQEEQIPESHAHEHVDSSTMYEKYAAASGKWISMEEGVVGVDLDAKEAIEQHAILPSKVESPMTTAQRIIILLVVIVVVAMIISLCVILVSNNT
jgi:acyl transferase domain-containing protein